MPQYLSPGVYVEEVDSGSRPIEGAGTAVAAFVGLAAAGPLHTPTLVSNWTQFTTTFGDFTPGSYLAHSVYGYFANGGANAYIVRIGADGAAGANGNGHAKAVDGAVPALGELSSGSTDKEPPYRVVAAEPGPAGNDISVEITHPEPEGDGEPSGNDPFNLLVRRGGNLEEIHEGLTTRKGVK